MNPPELAAPVVVGIDGSQAAIKAVLWAADEALTRSVPLRLVHVIDIDDDVNRDMGEEPAEIAKNWPETQYGRTSLRAASAAVQSTGKPVTVQTQIVWGDVDSMLLKESDRAAMVCVGSVGISRYCRELLGSTAATLAEQARSPVAIIRSPHSPPTSEPDWIVTAVDERPESNGIVGYAIDEARVRRAPVLALGLSQRGHRGVLLDDLERRVAAWRDHNPDLHIHPVSVPSDVAGFLKLHDELSVQLAVIGTADVDQVSAIVGGHRGTSDRHQGCSVLVVR